MIGRWLGAWACRAGWHRWIRATASVPLYECRRCGKRKYWP